MISKTINKNKLSGDKIWKIFKNAASIAPTAFSCPIKYNMFPVHLGVAHHKLTSYDIVCYNNYRHHHRRRTVTVRSIQTLIDFAARFSIQKQKWNHRLILLFYDFSKIRGQACFHSRLRQNYKSEPAEI